MNRLSLLYKLDELLGVCKKCEHKKAFNNTVSPNVICNGCKTYDSIRYIGANLGRKKQMPKVAFDMPIQDYIEMLPKMNKKEMAFKLKISEATLYAWINKHQEEINQLINNVKPFRKEKKTHECNCTKNDKSAEYEQLIKALRDDLNEAHKQIDEKDEQIRKLENVDAACDDVENEVSMLREEIQKLKDDCSKLLEKQYQDSYTLENWKNRMHSVVNENEKLQKENKALKELVKLWA